MMEWDPAVKSISKVTMATDSDVISVSFSCTSLIARVVHQIRESFGGEINAVYSRLSTCVLNYNFITKPLQ